MTHEICMFTSDALSLLVVLRDKRRLTSLERRALREVETIVHRTAKRIFAEYEKEEKS